MASEGLERGLTERQRLFVEEFLVDGNAAAAAVRAGYSPTRADSQGHRLKTLPRVRAAIEAGLAARARRGQACRDRVLEELSRIAFADISDFLRWDDSGVTLRPMDELTREQTACVAEIVESAGKTGKVVRVKLHGKLPALAALLKEAAGEDRPEADRPGPVIVLTRVPAPDPPPDESGPEGPPAFSLPDPSLPSP
jgi:phage terminase small subunit